MKKKTQKQDPYADREANKYENPIPSREFILDVLDASGPLSHTDLCEQLALTHEDDIEALRRRLIAMVRDGQIITNRKGAYGRVDLMDLVKGRVIAHRDGYGFVTPLNGGDDIYLSHRQMRKVFDGDEVLVRPGPLNSRGQCEGSIVEVLARNTQQVVGQFVNEGGGIQFVIPDNPKIHHDILIAGDQTQNAQHGQIVVVELLRQPDRHQRAQGRVVEILGDHLAPGMEIDVAIRSYGIPHEWSEAVRGEAEAFAAEVREKDKQDRIDLRELSFITIDGEDARDFDDAVYCETKRGGGWRLLVAIADVSTYVQPNSALDREAIKRGNSVYFPNFVVPMLPEQLSNGLCSLNPHVDRLCMVCEMTISQAGRISSYVFYEAVMHSKARMTYTKVGQILAERKIPESEIRQQYKHVVAQIDELYSLYKALREERTERGAIDFETTETRIIFDAERKIEKIVPVHRNDAHKLIEECMLAANVCAARFLEAHKIPALYRVHEAPKEEKLEALRAFLGELGLGLPAGEVTPASYQTVMKQVQDWPNVHLIQTVMLRSMNQAVYQPLNVGHFGLAYTSYTHFTSPIRRYPDLLVHRAIRSVIRSEQPSKKVQRCATAKILPLKEIYPYTQADMDSFGEQCSHTERRADDATRDVTSWLKCEYLQDHVGEVFEGVVSAVTGFGIFVELKDVFVEGLVHITALPQDYYRFHPAQHRLVGERTRKTFKLGDEVTVKVVRVSLDERKIDFELIESKSRRDGKKIKGVKADAADISGRAPRKRKISDDATADGYFKKAVKALVKKAKNATAKKSKNPVDKLEPLKPSQKKPVKTKTTKPTKKDPSKKK